MMKKCLRSRRNQVLALVIVIVCVIVYYFMLNESLHQNLNYDLAKRDTIKQYLDNTLQEALKRDKGSGCVVPQLDPFSKDIMALEKDYPPVQCSGLDWVACFQSTCRVKQAILKDVMDVQCEYRDIIYENDQRYVLSAPTQVNGDQPYILEDSDHVKVKCTGKRNNRYKWKSRKKAARFFASSWKGHVTGFRRSDPPKLPPGREDSYDVLIFGFDSTSKNGFIRRMPNSYEYITKKLGATVLNGYNILGDGTPAALFPILSGKNELDFPDARKAFTKHTYLDAKEFIFHKLRDYGYRTAYFEDSPGTGTFQYRFNGFNQKPADHYLRSFLTEDGHDKRSSTYCVGDTPLYKIMMNITDQFLQLDGKHYCFTFIADICHDEFSRISTADNDTVEFLDKLYKRGTFDNTLLIVMGDHGPRYARVRYTMQGKFEERLPLMAILLPKSFKDKHPEAQKHLENNTNVLTTAHDVYATVLDVLDLNHLRNYYKIPGADIPRALSLLKPIPVSRSCSEAGIQPHWCTCVAWVNVSAGDSLYSRVAVQFVDYVNSLTEAYRDKCAERTLTSISWVMKQQPNSKMISFVEAHDNDGYIGKFNSKANVDKIYYQLKVTLGPSEGIFEASATYMKEENHFVFNTRDISRINMYHNEPDCISASHPELNMFCYCIV